ncbi:Uncharacterized protein PECH_002882 [Penicillium ucsense]|uniref:Protein kinase domain-containing protein n=1 Tax=Penicillium ucsense TaxID=2839758 RepID=A0A8J8WIX4_9EURO|nr:Uncharacterized protein PECM_002664 [Penicillium ucsense]KAF7730205.1 Uncharacterized protein PECH_002882 [Penicillium ucsense]
MAEEYEDILDSIEDDNDYYSGLDDDLSPPSPAVSESASADHLDSDFSKIYISSEGSSWVDPLESTITATRNGSASVLSSLSQFTTILSRTGIHGPRLLKAGNLDAQATKIGSGGQFVVFKDPIFEGQVIKRVRVPLSSKGPDRFAASIEYRQQLKTLELEILSLCNPLLRSHPNITSLLAWGFDFPSTDLAVPVLFMEAAILPLDDFLKAEPRPFEVRYQFALDIANGLEALHHLRIVHGDVKPENVLVFASRTEKVPFCAKLSDFGVCLDLEASDGRATAADYRGTDAWRAPELNNDTVGQFGHFSPELLFKFDAYSFGLVLLSLFTSQGQALHFGKSHQDVSGKVSALLRDQQDITSDTRLELGKSIRNLLAEDPRERRLPSASMLKIDSPAYASWLAATQTDTVNNHVGIIDPIYNKGPLFWYRLDQSIRTELEVQNRIGKENDGPPFGGDVLLGIAQTITGEKPSYLDRMLTYLEDAATARYSPARAIYAQIMAAHRRTPGFCEVEMDKWALQAVSEGYLFVDTARYGKDRCELAKESFRHHGGFCSDPFLLKKDVKAAMNGDLATAWISKNGAVVDRIGNTLLHAAAAFGEVRVIKNLLDSQQVQTNSENDNGETPLYKAFQAGHAEAIELLLQRGADADTKTRQKVTPLHWLFMIPEQAVNKIARLMVRGGADVNALIEPVVKANSGGFQEKIQIFHYPFELPHGTPLHWACFFRHQSAMDTLLSLGADINAFYHAGDASSTPLSLMAYFGETNIVKYLVSHGADGTLLDSMGRNALHAISKYFPDRHGYLPRHWHYWIRHGTWEHHEKEMIDLVQALIQSGADLNAKDKGYPPLTPIAAAAELGVWNGGAISALLNAGADLESSLLSAGDTVLHTWASIVGPRLDYPESYLSTLERIVAATPNIDIANRFDEDTPLHLLTTTYHEEAEFEASFEIMSAHHKRPNINAKNRLGQTPLSIALETAWDPARRGLFLLDKGADPRALHVRDRDIFHAMANNAVLSDQATCDLIRKFLNHLDLNIENAYKQHYLTNPKSHESFIAAASRGKPSTVQLLLSLGLLIHLNKADISKSPPWTALDHALHAAELSRRAHIQKLVSYRAGPSRQRALEAHLVYEPNQGPPARAAEAYKLFPEVIQILRAAHALRTCEIQGLSSGDYIQQPREFDENELSHYKFTPDTQPNSEMWQVLYDEAKYESRGWLDKLKGGIFGIKK